jgi:hypothetical protein
MTRPSRLLTRATLQSSLPTALAGRARSADGTVPLAVGGNAQELTTPVSVKRLQKNNPAEVRLLSLLLVMLSCGSSFRVVQRRSREGRA